MDTERFYKFKEQYDGCFEGYKTKILHIWKALKQVFKEDYNYNLDHLRLKFSTKAVKKDGVTPDPENNHGGSWTENSLIYIDPEYKKIWKGIHAHYQDNEQGVIKWYANVMGHELAHELYSKVWDDEMKHNIEMSARKSDNFRTDYMDYVADIKKPDLDEFREELCVEYFGGFVVANKVIRSMMRG